MQLEIISTGDEVITGFITDTNVSYLAQELLSLGLQARFRHTVGDKLEDIIKLLSERSQEADIILVNGGLGPTTDDNTTQAAAQAAGVPQVLCEPWLAKIKAWHEARQRIMPQNNIKQAMLPAGATMIDNPRGTACGFYLKINRAMCFFTPGVPSEFKPMYQESIRPWLMAHLGMSKATQVKRFFCFGVSESKIGLTLQGLNLPKSTVIGYRAAYPLLEIKVITHGATDEERTAAIAKVKENLRSYLICEDNFAIDHSLSQVAGAGAWAIFDGATAGILPTMLSPTLNIKRALVGTLQEDPAIIAALSQDVRYVLTLKQGKSGDTILQLNDKDEPQHNLCCRYQLNITIKDKKKDAQALVAATLCLQQLSGHPLLRPDNAEMEIINGK